MQKIPQLRIIFNPIRSHRDNIKTFVLTQLQQIRNSSDKGNKKEPQKVEKVDQIKMPGFAHPETIKEEGYFTQRARQELEELKRKPPKDNLSDPEKKL